MKKKLLVLLALFLIVIVSSCGVIKERIEIKYGEQFEIEDKKLQKYESLDWNSEDAHIVSVDNGVINGNAPGNTVITAEANGKKVASYSVSVITVPITNIVLSTNTCEIMEGKESSLHYTLFPEDASDYGLKWKSADEAVATVDETGTITALSAGQTTISVSTNEGVVATCSVTVTLKPAYDRLSEKEKEFVDIFLKWITQFKNPESVKVTFIGFGNAEVGWEVTVSAQNGFGATSSSDYLLFPNTGFYEMSLSGVTSNMDIDLINEAIAERR